MTILFNNCLFFSYAEMDSVDKNKISHRYKALSKLKTYLQKEGQ